MNANEMTVEALEQKLKQVLLESEFFSVHEVSIDNISAETKLVADLAIDSVRLLELLLNVEESLGLNVNYENLTVEAFESIGTLARYFHGQMAESA